MLRLFPVDLRGRAMAIPLATLAAPVSWGTTYVVVTELMPDDRPLLVSALRALPAGLLLAAVSLMTSRWRPRGAEWGRQAALAVLNIGAFFPLLVVAVYRLPGGVAAAFGGVQPLLVPLITWVVAGNRPRRFQLAVGAVAAAGVAMVVLRPGAAMDWTGSLAALGANVSFALGVVLTKRWPAPSAPVAATGWQLLLASVLLVPLAAVVEGPPPAFETTHLLGTGYLSIAATGFAFLLWFRGVRALPAAAPPLLGLAAPVTGAAMGWLVLGEALTPVQLVGFAVTVGAIAYGALGAAREGGRTPTVESLRRRAPRVPAASLARSPVQPCGSAAGC
jgi:probable blue pigment (indigoidine) exporter